MTDPQPPARPWPLARWGKHWGLRRLADAQGLFSMVAIDQRPPIVQRVASALGIVPGAVGFADIVQVKALLAESLAPQASALLVDPDFGLPAATPYLQPGRGLLITLEEHRYDDAPDGRRSRLIPNWSVAQIRRLGADAVKLPAWMRRTPSRPTSRPWCGRWARPAPSTTSPSSWICWCTPLRPLLALRRTTTKTPPSSRSG